MSVEAGAIPREFSKRPGARLFWGAVTLGTLTGVYQLTSGLINPLLVRDLPVTLDVGALLGTVALAVLAGAFVGALTLRPDGAGAGVLIGAAAFGVLTSLIWSIGAGNTGGFLAVIVLAPAVAVGLGICTALRLALSGPLRRGLWAWLAAVILGIFGGYWSRFSATEIAEIKLVQAKIQEFAALPHDAQTPLAFVQAPHLRDHTDRPYTFGARTVQADPATVEVTVTYDDGYVLSCLVIGKTPRCSEFGRTDLGGPSSGP